MVIWMCLDSWWELLSLYFYQREQERGNLILVDHSVFLEADRGYDWYAAWRWPGLDWTECQHPHPTAEAAAGGGGLVAGWLSPYRGVGPGHQPAPCTSPCLHTAMTKGECVWATQVRHDSRYIFMFVIMFVSSTQWCMYINAGRCSPGLRGEQWWW